MKSVALTAYPRSTRGRTAAKKTRQGGRIPAVVYGRGSEARSLEVSEKDIEQLIHHSVSETRLVDLAIDGEEKEQRLALLQEIQHHPLRGNVLHIDLRLVSETERVVVSLPVETKGEPVEVKTGGGLLEHVLFRVRVRALPKDIPEFIEVDVTELGLDETIHLGDLKLGEGVEVLGDRNIPVVSIAVPRGLLKEEEEAEAETKEPEAIKEKKAPEEEEENKD